MTPPRVGAVAVLLVAAMVALALGAAPVAPPPPGEGSAERLLNQALDDLARIREAREAAYRAEREADRLRALLERLHDARGRSRLREHCPAVPGSDSRWEPQCP